MAGLMHLLRELLKKQNAWLWGQMQQQAFDELKSELASEKNQLVLADASNFRLGNMLLQRSPGAVLTFASRSVADT